MDGFTIEVLPDGETLKITTDSISPANHGKIDQLLMNIIRASGGKASRTFKGVHHQHHHTHTHESQSE